MKRAAEILVAGAGPTGLALALQAHELGAHVRVVERRLETFRPSRALIMHPRTLEVLRPLGVVPSLLACADTAPEANLYLGSRVAHLRLGELDIPDTAFPHLTLMRQMDVEQVLTQALVARGVEVERGIDVVEVEDGVSSARARLRSRAGIETVECDFIAGCDGPASTVRGQAGIGWHGQSYSVEVVLADLDLDADLDYGIAHVVADRNGMVFVFALGERATWRLLGTRPAGCDQLPFGQPGPPVPIGELQALLHDRGFNARITSLAWSARYRLQRRIARRFRQGRLFLAGDAAHSYSPATGQGMNTGIQDAMNLGWKLAFAPYATDSAALLDSYDLERRPVIRRVLALTRLAFWLEASTGMLPSLLRGVVGPIGAPAVPVIMARRRLLVAVVRSVSQLRVNYPASPVAVEGWPRLSEGPRAGARLPDAVVTADGNQGRLHTVLAQPGIHVLLHGDADDLEHLDFGRHVTVHRLESAPGTGLVAVRPDGYIGFRCQVADVGQLREWLAHVGACHHAGNAGL